MAANDKALATTTPTSTALATTAPSSVPDYIETSREGLETFSKDDVLIPRLTLAQALSPQVTDGDPKRIPDLKPGMLFNSMTGENYGKSVRVQILRKDALRAMEFFSQDDGGGVKDPNVSMNDPRTRFGPNGEKPAATTFRDYIARILPPEGVDREPELVALSFKSSGLAAAKALNGFIALRRTSPIYAGAYQITSDTQLKPKPHFVYIISNSGWVTKDQYEDGKALYASVKDLDTSKVDRDMSADDDMDFAHGANVGERVPGSDDI